jgi:hypothetical protein
MYGVAYPAVSPTYPRGVRRIVALSWFGLGACAPQSSESWRECGDAFAQLPHPQAPTETPPVVPVEVGDTLPMLRITGQSPDADALANRALASACVLTDGDVSATRELQTWAELVLEGELFPEVGDVFEPPLSVQSWPSESVALDLAVSRESDAPRPEPPTAGVDVGVGSTAAQAVAEAAITQLVERRMIADTELRLSSTSQLRSSLCDANSDVCHEYVERYSFVFASHLAGAAVIGSWVVLDVDREGALVGLRLGTVDIELGGETVAAVDEAQAEQRFLELAQAEHPMLDVEIHTRGQVAYVVPGAAEAMEVEPVWYGGWITSSDSGVIGRPQWSSLSLSDASAPLVPRDP